MIVEILRIHRVNKKKDTWCIVLLSDGLKKTYFFHGMKEETLLLRYNSTLINFY